jgi:6-phosphogluconolactonase
MIERFPTREALAEGVARHVIEHAAAAIAATGRFTLALAGGSTPRAAYARLTSDDLARRVEWGLVHVVWGDERCVPPDDPHSNYRMARETLLDHVPIPEEQIHRIRGEDEPEQAALQYERELRELLDRGAGSAPAGLDLVLLGMGEDGHTASLFPGESAVREAARWVVGVPARQDGTRRVTLTPVVLNAARAIGFMVSGAAKAARLRQVLQGPFTPDLLPVQVIRPVRGQLTWMVDQGAAPHPLAPSP